MSSRAFLALLTAPLLLLMGAHYLTTTPAKCDPRSLSPADTRQSVIEKCGTPGHINASTNHEQMVYSNGFPLFGGTYIYIDNGHFSDAQWEE
jgi:hypothetical protein